VLDPTAEQLDQRRDVVGFVRGVVEDGVETVAFCREHLVQHSRSPTITVQPSYAVWQRRWMAIQNSHVVTKARELLHEVTSDIPVTSKD
jgi:hypothetical protein